ncbi:hypothetical protein BZA05DRAFT_396731, partial [Tricharina praecox]|uniref:uncharacterized protein n=1 Tax=Tricharina praecox TaxID=43433 RepID=UPI00221FDDA7
MWRRGRRSAWTGLSGLGGCRGRRLVGWLIDWLGVGTYLLYSEGEGKKIRFVTVPIQKKAYRYGENTYFDRIYTLFDRTDTPKSVFLPPPSLYS